MSGLEVLEMKVSHSDGGGVWPVARRSVARLDDEGLLARQAAAHGLAQRSLRRCVASPAQPVEFEEM